MEAIINLYEAKTKLSKLVDQAAMGEDVVIARNGKPVARITSLKPAKPKVKFGILKGTLTVPADFDAPLPADILSSFEG